MTFKIKKGKIMKFVSIIMGSKSDYEIMKKMLIHLKNLMLNMKW